MLILIGGLIYLRYVTQLLVRLAHKPFWNTNNGSEKISRINLVLNHWRNMKILFKYTYFSVIIMLILSIWFVLCSIDTNLPSKISLIGGLFMILLYFSVINIIVVPIITFYFFIKKQYILYSILFILVAIIFCIFFVDIGRNGF